MGGQGGTPDAGKPQIFDQAPPRWTGVPLERDPVSGRLLSGDPLGRGDKGRGNTGRGVRTPGKTALITGGAVAVAAAVALTVFLVARDEEDPALAASAGGAQTSSGVQDSEQTTTSAAPSTTTPAAETGPRTVPITLTTVAVTPPPGFGPDPEIGSVGDVLALSWTLTGPCDGAGPCQVQQCDTAGCGDFDPGEPQGSGYVTRFSEAVTWPDPECTGGTIENTVTWTVTGEGDDITVTGSWTRAAAQVLFTGSDGRDCGLYLAEWAIASQ